MSEQKTKHSGPMRHRRQKARQQTPYSLDRSQTGALAAGKGRMASLTAELAPWMPIYPPRTVRQLRYCDSVTLSQTSGAPTGYVLRANDLFDPNFTGTGHQPMGFDQIMIAYNHFCVTKARLRAIFRNLGTSPCSVCIRQDASSTLPTVITNIQEMGGGLFETLEAKGVYGSIKELELSVDVARLQGLNVQAITADPTLRGDAATSPTEVTYFHLMTYDADVTTGSVFIDYILEQDSVFMEPRDQSGS